MFVPLEAVSLFDLEKKEKEEAEAEEAAAAAGVASAEAGVAEAVGAAAGPDIDYDTRINVDDLLLNYPSSRASSQPFSIPQSVVSSAPQSARLSTGRRSPLRPLLPHAKGNPSQMGPGAPPVKPFGEAIGDQARARLGQLELFETQKLLQRRNIPRHVLTSRHRLPFTPVALTHRRFVPKAPPEMVTRRRRKERTQQHKDDYFVLYDHFSTPLPHARCARLQRPERHRSERASATPALSSLSSNRPTLQSLTLTAVGTIVYARGAGPSIMPTQHEDTTQIQTEPTTSSPCQSRGLNWITSFGSRLHPH